MGLAIVLAVVGTYLITCALHPYKKCPACKATPGRHYGGVFMSSWRACHRCNGKSRLRRVGAHLLNAGARDESTSRLQHPKNI